MIKNFHTVEDVIADESFLAWYNRDTEAAIVQWENWLKANPDYQSLVGNAIEMMDKLSQAETAATAEEIESKLALLNDRLYETTPVITMKPSRSRWWMAAAAAVLLLVGGFTFFKLYNSGDKLGTAYGEICNNQLPDGSTMILNANSTARLSEGWENGKDREVWLNGEAFFKVTKTAEKSRFIVHTGNLDVIVTGTQFNVLYRDNQTRVLLTEGSVTIRTKDGQELAMKPGDYIEMAGEVKRKIAVEENILAWTENKLAFDNTPMREVAQIINNHYGVAVTLADEAVAGKSITGIMSNVNLDDLLKAIELAADIRISKTGKEITFSNNK